MKNSVKGALLSGLVFPGLGQLVLKHPKSGVVLIFTFTANMAIAVMEAAKAAMAIIEQVQLSGGMVDMAVITDAATRASSDFGTFRFNFALLLAFICWVLGIVDAYIIGKKKDKAEAMLDKAFFGHDN